MEIPMNYRNMYRASPSPFAIAMLKRPHTLHHRILTFPLLLLGFANILVRAIGQFSPVAPLLFL